MSDRFSHLWPPQHERIFSALEAVYNSGDWGRYHGRETDQLQANLEETFSCSHVHLVCSGTIGIELALRGVGVQEGDEVILAAYDYPGNFRSIEAVGSRPVLADIECTNWSLCPDSFEAAISANTRAVIVSSLHGGLADIQRICEISRRHGISVIEDACQAPGALISGQRVGSFGDVAVLSFGGSKLLSSGRGGAVLTNDQGIWQRINVFKDRGNDTFALSQLEAAVLNPQLEMLDEFNAVRTANALKIISQTEPLPGVHCLSQRPGDVPVFYKIAWLAGSSQHRSSLLARARQLGLPLFEGFRGFVTRSDRRCGKPVSLVNSERAAAGTMLLHHPVLLADQQVIADVGIQIAELFDSVE